VLRALIEEGIQPDLVVGSSAGAVNGAWYALNPDGLDDLETIWRGLTQKRVFPGTVANYGYNLLRHGHIHRIEPWGSILDAHYGDKLFEATLIPFVAITVRMSDGAVVPHDRGPISPVLKASTAVPGLFPPQDLNGELHIDGAVVEFLPIPTAVRYGATRIYAVDSSHFPADGTAETAIDRAGQIAASAWVNLVLERARAAGVNVTRFRPPLGSLYDGRDFRHTERLLRDGYSHARQILAAYRDVRHDVDGGMAAS
jgi:predicted acylesterase/phospholipase RssA